jgi:hypothetical protein
MNLASSFVACALVAAAVTAQCHIATSVLYQGTQSNPVSLRSESPGQYAVPGTVLRLTADGRPVAILGLSAGRLPGRSLTPHRHELLIDDTAMLGSLLAFGTPPTWLVTIPNNHALLGMRAFCQSFHRASDGLIDASNGVAVTVGWIQSEIEVEWVAPPDNLVGDVGPRDYVVRLRNHGNVSTLVPVTVRIGGCQNTATLGPVPAFGAFQGVVRVCTPPANGPICGNASQGYTVTATANFTDCNPTNNVATANARVAVRYWDLRFSIVNSRASAARGSTTRWDVRVENVGNFPSESRCARTAIMLGPDCFQFTHSLQPVPFDVPSIGPGRSWTFEVRDYPIPPWAAPQTQSIVAAIGPNCVDLCGTGNCGTTQIQIR